ncbi:hypothetical protein [Sulfurimonas sp. NWX79]|uniref:hypothetical protein n=1 Tax=Sulfurimonas sp. NWX79 TaxID=2925412 RepID=UPI0032047A33
MRTFLATVLFILLFIGCAQKNAFEKFHFTSVKELSEDSIQTLKIKKGTKVEGVINVIHLNKVLPEMYNQNEYFYVYYYIKDKNDTVTFTLNGKPSLLQEELESENEFSYLTSFTAPWSKYCLLGFQKEGNVLNLKIETSKAVNATLQFVKDK